MTESKANDGGPAFPCDVERYNPATDVTTRTPRSGMSLRDWFAGMAMQHMVAGQGAQQVADLDGRYDGTNWDEVVAMNAYEFADAMLAQRAKAKEAASDT